MDIDITQTINAYPQWVEDYSLVPARIGENAPVNTIVKRLRATSSIPDSLVHYIIQPGEIPEQNGQPRSFYYRIDDRTNEMILLTYKPLDYEALPRYTLTIKAAVRQLALPLITFNTRCVFVLWLTKVALIANTVSGSAVIIIIIIIIY